MDTFSLITSLSGLFIAGVNCAIFIIIKFNDMAHLTKDVKELTDVVKESIVKQEKLAERISTIEGRCSANHS